MEFLKNLIWLIVGGVALLMFLGATPEGIKATVDDFSDLVEQEIADTGRSPSGHYDQQNSGNWVIDDFESQAASRPYSGR